jgi:PTH2 family peptidyl-tRNA hydrolase
MFRFKQAIVVRADVPMSPGKMAAQVAHAAVSAAERTRAERPEWFHAWMREGQKKVVLKVHDEDSLRRLKGEAEGLGMVCEIVSDAGLTEIPPGTVTALGIGPAPAELVDRVTGRLSLL